MEGLMEIRGGSEHLWRRGWHEAGSLLRRDGWREGGGGSPSHPHLARVTLWIDAQQGLKMARGTQL